VWIKVGLEKLESHKGVAVKVLLDSGAMGLFMDMAFAKRKGFRIEKMKKPLLVKNMDGSANIGGAIMHLWVGILSSLLLPFPNLSLDCGLQATASPV